MRGTNVNLYELTAERQAAIDALEVDPETGEVTGFEAFDALDMAFEDKLEAYGISIKNLLSEAGQLDAERKVLQERSDTAKKKAESLKARVSEAMQAAGKDKYRTARVELSFRKSEAVEIDGRTKLDEKYLRYKKPEPDKTAIKQALKTGIEIPGAALVTKRNLQIK